MYRRGDSAFYLREIQDKRREIERLTDRLKKAEDVIRWYADINNYYEDKYGINILKDDGKQARDYLKEVGSE